MSFVWGFGHTGHPGLFTTLVASCLELMLMLKRLHFEYSWKASEPMDGSYQGFTELLVGTAHASKLAHSMINSCLRLKNL